VTGHGLNASHPEVDLQGARGSSRINGNMGKVREKKRWSEEEK